MSAAKFLIVCFSIALTLHPALARDSQQPRVLGNFTISTGMKVAGIEFGGLSGLDFDPVTELHRSFRRSFKERPGALL